MITTLILIVLGLALSFWQPRSKKIKDTIVFCQVIIAAIVGVFVADVLNQKELNETNKKEVLKFIRMSQLNLSTFSQTLIMSGNTFKQNPILARQLFEKNPYLRPAYYLVDITDEVKKISSGTTAQILFMKQNLESALASFGKDTSTDVRKFNEELAFMDFTGYFYYKVLETEQAYQLGDITEKRLDTIYDRVNRKVATAMLTNNQQILKDTTSLWETIGPE
jgi:hypothetical protein